ncbi:hypothetical protein ACV3P0_12550 [Clostridium perfringens]|nr:hypothetical protein [Cutibacterium avidum]MDU8975577.1 hypothetical protein [Clostridium perfringens]
MDKIFDKYKINKNYKIARNRTGFPMCYLVEYSVEPSSSIRFKDLIVSLDPYIRINGIEAKNFTNEFFEKNKIQIKEEKEKIIPLGLIECCSDSRKYKFSIAFSTMEEVYNSKEIIDNFEKALKLRCDALDFISNFEGNIFEDYEHF